MAKRFIDTDLITKSWFRSLSQVERLFFIYIFSKCDIAGVWEIDFEAAKFYCGNFDEKSVVESLKDQIILTDCKKRFWLKDFVTFQYGTILNPRSPVHAKIISFLKKHRICSVTLFDTLLNTLLNRGKEEDKEEEEEEEVKGAQIENLISVKIQEIKNSTTWIEQVGMKQKIPPSNMVFFLSEFLEKESLKSDFLEKSLNETKDHFVNWLVKNKNIKLNGTSASNDRVLNKNAVSGTLEQINGILGVSKHVEAGPNSIEEGNAIVIESRTNAGGSHSPSSSV